jgi:glutathione S-transferase
MITLYRAPFSTNVERVALALAHKGIEIEAVEIDYADRSPVIEVSGQPLVPVIVDDGQAIADSTRILRHLEERNPDPPLFPSEPCVRAGMDIFLEWFNEVWKGPPNEIDAELGKPDPDHDRIADLAARMRAWLDIFENLLEGRDHLLGDDFSAADCAAFPFLKYAALPLPEGDDERFHQILADNLALNGGYPRLEAWIHRVDERPREYG